MRLLLTAVCSNENLNGYDHAVVDIDPDLATLILDRFELFRMLMRHPGANQIHEMRFHCIAAQWLNDQVWGDDDLVSAMGEKEFIEIPDTLDIPMDWHAPSRGDYMVIRNLGANPAEPLFEVCWVCRPKYNENVHCETADLDIETLKIAARGGVL